MIGTTGRSADEKTGRRPRSRPRRGGSANAVEPSGRCARTSRTRPPTKAQTRPASRPIATVTTIRPDEHQDAVAQIPTAQVRPDGQFQQGRHRRTDRGEQQGHRASRSSADGLEGRATAHTVPTECGRYGGDLAAKYPTDGRFGAAEPRSVGHEADQGMRQRTPAEPPRRGHGGRTTELASATFRETGLGPIDALGGPLTAAASRSPAPSHAVRDETRWPGKPAWNVSRENASVIATDYVADEPRTHHPRVGRIRRSEGTEKW